MAGKSSKWAAFPHDAKGYAYTGDALKKAWPALHAGDQEPYPDEKRAKALIAAAGKAAKGIEPADLAQRLQDAWRAFHRGDFQAAYEAGEALGPLGASACLGSSSSVASSAVRTLPAMPCLSALAMLRPWL